MTPAVLFTIAAVGGLLFAIGLILFRYWDDAFDRDYRREVRRSRTEHLAVVLMVLGGLVLGVDLLIFLAGLIGLTF
jgi:uncharacterized membrane protein YidH (DUF202 family)